MPMLRCAGASVPVDVLGAWHGDRVVRLRCAWDLVLLWCGTCDTCEACDVVAVNLRDAA